MPGKKTIGRARKDAREGKAPSTQAGEFVREEIEHVREGKHGARSPEQAIAIGLSKARREGIKVKPPANGKSVRKGKSSTKPSAQRSRSAEAALKKEDRSAASHRALSQHAKRVARRVKRYLPGPVKTSQSPVAYARGSERVSTV